MDRTTIQNRFLAAEQILYRASKTLLKNDKDCADVVQEAIPKAWISLPKLRADCADDGMEQKKAKSI